MEQTPGICPISEAGSILAQWDQVSTQSRAAKAKSFLRLNLMHVEHINMHPTSAHVDLYLL